MDPRDNFYQADLHDAPGGPEGVPADWAELGVLAALLAVVRLAQVLQVLQLPELLSVEGKGWKITNHKTKQRVDPSVWGKPPVDLDLGCSAILPGPARPRPPV